MSPEMSPEMGPKMSNVEHGVAQWLTLIQAEFREMPGLRLTKPQVQRLWGLDPITCDAVVDALEAAKFLKRTSGSAYSLFEAGV